MVKAKQQKPKPKKQPYIKKQGKQGDVSQFRAQLDALGLKIIEVTADGNCFFRALADQLEGNEEEHGKYRSMVVQYILKNREMFEPFIEDDVPFDEYCQTMEKDGTWAGHMELQASSLVSRSNICIHRNMSPRWYIQNFDHAGARMVHLSYHDEEHYNSLRLKEDPCDGPARPVIIKADADLSASSHQAKVAVSKSKGAAGTHNINAGVIKLVMAGSGCENAEKVGQVLLQVGGDADAAIEFLIAEQGTEEYSAENYSQPCHADNPYVPKQSTLQRIERRGSIARKEDLLNLHHPMNLMECHLMSVLFVYDPIPCCGTCESYENKLFSPKRKITVKFFTTVSLTWKKIPQWNFRHQVMLWRWPRFGRYQQRCSSHCLGGYTRQDFNKAKIGRKEI